MTDPNTTPSVMPADALLRRLSEHTGVTQADVRKVLSALEDAAGDVLFAGEAVRLPGIGILEPRAVPAREGVSLGKAWSKPAGRKVVFKPAKALRDRIA
jgi:DNA-binding protein HU-beta